MPIGDYMGNSEGNEESFADRPNITNGNTKAGLGILRPNKRRKPKRDPAAQASLAEKAQQKGSLGYPSTAAYSSATGSLAGSAANRLRDQ